MRTVKEAFRRLPETCPTLNKLVDKAAEEIMQEFQIPKHDRSRIIPIMSRLFYNIRDEITDPFRVELIRAIREGERNANAED